MQHSKKLLAAAVAGAFAAVPGAAVAQGSTVQIGGNLHLIYGMHNPNNDSISSKHDNLHMSEPEMRIRGEEKLGGGLSVWFQCTSSFDVIGTAAQSTTGGAQFCGRNSGIGFKGGWGNLFAGTWDTPHKLNYNQARGWFSGTNVFGGTATLLYSGSQSNAGQTGASFYRRQARMFSYHSPRWGGFSVNAAISSGNERATEPDVLGLEQRLWSVAGMYRGGPLYVGLSYERHEDFNPGAAPIAAYRTTGGGSDDGWSLVGVYTIANSVRLSGVYARNEYENTLGGGVDTLRTRGWATYVDWRIAGPHSLKAQYGRARSPQGTIGAAAGNYMVLAAGGTGGKAYTIAYAYDMSKRTQAYVGYAYMKNDSNTAGFDKGIVDASLGGKQTFTGVGLRHRF
jgi:predicted porin